MQIDEGCCVRQQNEYDVDDSCFDTSEIGHMCDKLLERGISDFIPINHQINPDKFIDNNGKLQRHLKTKFPNDISSDQAHMYALWTNDWVSGLKDLNVEEPNWPRTNDEKSRLVSIGFLAGFLEMHFISNLSLLFQMFLFWIPVRWCDGNDPTIRIGFIKLHLGYRHHAGDYRLFKQCLYYAPYWIKCLVSKKTLKKMSRYYWFGPKWKPWDVAVVTKEPNVMWVIDIDDKFIDYCLR